jgi:signal transduction histidine kinase/ligand-binding sensor domain-containing protein
MIPNFISHSRRTAILFLVAVSHLGNVSADHPQSLNLLTDVPLVDQIRRHYSIEHGLPSNQIHNLLQTRDGFLWIATHNGLARYDGRQFRVFNRSNTPQLPANDTRVLYETDDGILWIGTVGGLLQYKPGRPGTFHELETFRGNSIHALEEDNSAKLWIGTREKTWSRAKGAQFEVVEEAPSGVKAIFEDQIGTLWLGSDHGLYMQQGTEYVRIASDRLPTGTSKDGGIPLAGVNVLLADGVDVWAGTNLGLLHIKDGHFTDRGSEAGQQQIYDMIQTQNGGLYLATRFGLQRSVEGSKFEKLSNDELVSCIMEDAEGGLWVGHHENGGLDHYRNGETRTILNQYRVNCVHEASDGIMWFGSYSGLHRLKDGVMKNYGIADGLPDVRVQTITQGSGGTLWIGTRKGFARWSGNELSSDANPSNLVQMNISAAYEDSSGVLWFALSNGGAYSLKDDTLRELEGMNHGKTCWFCEDAHGGLWIGHEYGLYFFGDDQLQQITNPELDRLNSSHFIGHYAAKDGSLWLSTSGGIARYQSGRFHVFTSQDGLLADYIDRIVEDHHGHLWMGGRDGFFHVSISEFDDVTAGRLKKVKSHRVEHVEGVPVSRHYPKVCFASDGETWIAGRRGVIRVPRELLQKKAAPPKVHIEQVKIDAQVINVESEIEFHSGPRRLAIEFTAPAFARLTPVQIKYRLDGYDEDWIDAGDERIAHYTRLIPGEYHFRIIAADTDGVWNENEQTIRFLVTPRWWEISWVRVTACLAAIGLSMLYVNRRIRRYRRANCLLRREISDRKKAEEKSHRQFHELARVSRAASMGELSASIAHEVKQPLFAIVSNAEATKRMLNHDQPDLPEIQEALNDIISDGNRASDIVDHIRSLLRKEPLERHQLDLSEVARKVTKLISPELRNRGLTVRTELYQSLPTIEGDAIELQQVILNLIFNGAQAMGDRECERNELIISTSTNNGSVELTVRDFGVGLDGTEVERIFEPFYTTRPSGTGMGLAINRTIIEAHGGHIWAVPNDDWGATFGFQLPTLEENTV